MEGAARLIVLCTAALMFTLSAADHVVGRTHCGPNDIPVVTGVNTTDRLVAFRTAMAGIRFNSKSLSAFVVYSGDAHNSEYPSDVDKRRGFISGFGGSAGTAVITLNKAALWTDGRYYLEADNSLDCNWSLMKSGLPDTPTIADWLNSEMESVGEYIGVDKTLITEDSFKSLNDSLASLSKKAVLALVDGSTNPVDAIWREGRPPPPTNPVNALDLKFAGVSWQDKVKSLRSNLTACGAGAFVVTALDEIAWLFNLRGSDIDFNPFFLAYSIVEHSRIRLYLMDRQRRLTAAPTDTETTVKLYQHLSTDDKGRCTGMPDPCVEVLSYIQADVEKDLKDLANTTKIWVTPQTNYGILLAVQNNHTVALSPLAIDKSMKNPTERNGMKNSHNRDSAALIKFLAFMEKEIKSDKHWTEVSASQELAKRRKALQYNRGFGAIAGFGSNGAVIHYFPSNSTDKVITGDNLFLLDSGGQYLELKYNRGLSFETIAGFGSNGAIIHYRPSNSTDKVITGDRLFLLDSGGQYLDGTTDVTRTLHYGTPTDYQKECYTRVLMSAINLALMKWPEGLLGREMDVIARKQLWDVGLVYKHGTGHGIGAYLSVHEGPGSISYLRKSKHDYPLKAYQYYSDEPGYYEDGSFGIRLETILTIVPFNPKFSTSDDSFLQFMPVTLVPFEPILIDYTLMDATQVDWLNEYNSKIRENILALLGDDQLAIEWVNARTQVVKLEQFQNGARMFTPSFMLLTFLLLIYSCISTAL